MRDRDEIELNAPYVGASVCVHVARLRRATSLLAGVLGLAGLSACLTGDEVDTDEAVLAASGGGVTIDVVSTGSWGGGFNAAVRVTNNSFPAPITAFDVVFRLNGTAGIPGQSWNGNISPPDGSGQRTATNPSWLPSQPITTGGNWDVGFTGSGVFSGATIVSARINGQNIPLDGGNGNDTTPPTATLASSATQVTTAGPLTLNATANDNVGVARVEFLDGTTVLGSDTSSPYSFTVDLTSAQNGAHTYRARAVDAANNTGTSAAVTVTVNIPTGPGPGPGPSTVYSTGSGRFFVNGVERGLFGLNWFGLETSDRVLHGLWTGRQLSDFLADIRSKGFNALRLPLSPQTINPGFPIGMAGPAVGEDGAALTGRDGRTALEYTLGKAQQAGLLVLLDFHTCDPARLGAQLPGSPINCANYTQARWIADIETMARLSLTFTNVIGVDLTNEPHMLTWAQWSNLVSQAGQAALRVNPNITIWVEGVGNASNTGGFAANWGQNLHEAGAIPGIPANRLVFSPHSYGPSVAVMDYFSAPNYPNNMPQVWDTLWGNLVNQGFTVVTGEFGGHYTTSGQASLNDRLWQDSFVTYLISKGARSNFYWAVNPNSGDTGGVYGDDWRTWNAAKLSLLQRLMQ